MLKGRTILITGGGSGIGISGGNRMPEQLGFTTKGVNVHDFAKKTINAINQGQTEYAPDPHNILVSE